MKQGNTYRISCTACNSLDITRNIGFVHTMGARKKLDHITCNESRYRDIGIAYRGFMRKQTVNTWYRVHKYQGAMFLEATPHGELACRFRKVLIETKLKIKIVEKPGSSIRWLLCSTYSLKNTTCTNENWKMCKINPDITCRTRNEIYSIKCIECACKEKTRHA